MKILNLLLLTFLFPLILISQTLDWVSTYGSISDDRNYKVAISPNGNILTTGYFKNTVDFDPDTSTYNLSSNGNKDISIVCYSQQGKLLWARAIGGRGEDFGFHISTDKNNNIYITGFF